MNPNAPSDPLKVTSDGQSAPPGQSPQPTTTAPTPAPPPQAGFFMSDAQTQSPIPPDVPTSQGNKRKIMRIVVVCVVILAVILGVLVALKKPTTSTNTGSANAQSNKLAAQLQTLSRYGGHLQSTDLAKFDKTALFYAVFKHAAMQQVVGATTDRYQGANATDQSTRALEFRHQATFDYRSKQLAEETQDAAGGFFERCVNGKNYTYDDINTNSWQAQTGPTADCGSSLSYEYDINDGINTGGLSDSQAQKFVSTIAGATGLVSVDDMKYVTHDGAPYIRLSVTIHPVKVDSSSYQGMGVILGAFDATGLNASTWPYGTTGSLATGAKFIYYINPATQLPAYSQTSLTYSLDDATGQQKPDLNYDFQDTVYTFGGAVRQLPLGGVPTKLVLSWPEEKV